MTILESGSRHRRATVGAVGAVAAAGMLTLAACGGASEPQQASGEREAAAAVGADDTLVVGLVTQNLERTFFTGLVDGAQARADEIGVELIVVDGRDDLDVQTDGLDRLVSNETVDAIILSPIDSGAAPAQVEAALERGLPVVAVANQIGSAEQYGPQFVYPGTVALVTNDDVDMGRKAGLFVAATADAQSIDIAVLMGKAGTANAELRLDGFTAELDALGVDHDLVANIPGDWNADGGAAACDEFVALPNVDLIYSMSDAMTAGCVEALDEAGVELPIVSIGGNAQGVELLTSGRIVGSVCQKPATMGALAIDSAVEALVAGRDNQGLRFYDTPVVTADTLDDCRPQW